MTLTFADTYYYLALVNPRDKAHRRAVRASEQVTGRVVTTQWVLTEVGDALAARKDRSRFVALVASLEASPDVTIVPASDELFRRGMEFYRQRGDKDWPLTDCISFVVMEGQSIREALTEDAHFKQAGFVVLLAEE